MSIKKTIIFLALLWSPFVVLTSGCQVQQQAQVTANTASLVQDSIAEKMLLIQRSNGGWPQPGGNAINYNKALSESEKTKYLSEKNKLDATIDDQATTREIKYLMGAHDKTKNPAYLKAAENSVRYLLQAQNKAGGWPQFYPDSSGYHKHITYNDQAMIDVLWVMKYTATGQQHFEPLQKTLGVEAQKAVDKGIECILKTQYYQGSTLTVWCAQHDSKTLQPAKARAFELPSLSGNESVGILRFLMAVEQPSDAVKKAIHDGVAWLEAVKIKGFKVQDIADPSQPKGKDRVIVPDPNSVLWARFYDLKTNQPFFVGRDSQAKATLAEIENERRTGYAYYGTWPAKLIDKEYPTWKVKHGE
jgi:PelA/Pel-15E family pectate lyase